MKDIHTRIFTDGASRGNPGRGGWGAIVVMQDSAVAEIGGRADHTTNNKMELTAVLQGLQLLQEKNIKHIDVIVYTDSSYVVNGITKWVIGWQKNGWRTQNKQDVLNKELWQSLIGAVSQFNVDFNLLPGHAGIPGNERCDEIATAYADGDEPDLYEGPLDAYKVSLDVVIDAALLAQKKSTKTKSKTKAYSYVSCVGGKVETHKSWAACEARVRGVGKAKYRKVLTPDEEKKLIAEWTQNS